MMPFVLLEAQLPARRIKGFNTELHCRDTLVICVLICFKTPTKLLKYTLELDCAVNLYIVLFLGIFRRRKLLSRLQPLSLFALHFSETL